MPPTNLQLMCHLSMCTEEWYPTASTLCPLSLPRKKTIGNRSQQESQLYSKQSLKFSGNASFPENFLNNSGYFKQKPYCVTVLRWLKKEEKV